MTCDIHPMCEEYSAVLVPRIRTPHEACAKDYKVDNENGAA